MAINSGIEWTESTWNPVTGCTKISEGCRHCYAERMANRLQAMGQPNYEKGFGVAMHEHALGLPLTWRKPQTIFVNSMSDLFHEEIPLAFIRKVFEVMHKADWHRFQILTKRGTRLAELAPKLYWPRNVWMGVTVESAKHVDRIDCLRTTGAHLKFLSCEPLLSALPRLNLEGIDWVIAGGESGPGARPVEDDWVRGVRDQRQLATVPFFFKQWGGVNKKKAGRELDGETWDEMPPTSASASRTTVRRTAAVA